jgi:hypothetical protein
MPVIVMIMVCFMGGAVFAAGEGVFGIFNGIKKKDPLSAEAVSPLPPVVSAEEEWDIMDLSPSVRAELQNYFRNRRALYERLSPAAKEILKKQSIERRDRLLRQLPAPLEEVKP